MKGAKQKKMFEISDLRRKILHLRSVCLSPPGVLLYFHAYVGLSYFWGFKILNFNILGFFQKTECFWKYEDFVDIFWGHHKIGLYDAFQGLL